MFRPLLSLAFFLISGLLPAQETSSALMRSVYLVGNVANVPSDAPILVGLQNLTASETAPFTVLYSGDLIDDDGLEAEDCEEEEEKLRGLIRIGQDNPLGRVLFIPGERDWDNAGKSGLAKIRRLEDFLEKELRTKRALIPTKGCPGPMVIDVGDDLRIIAINTQWFQHQYQRPGEADDCPFFNENEFYDEIDDFMEEVPGRNIIVVAHHPVYSFGQSAGYRSVRRHFFPLTDVDERLWVPVPLLGTFYAAHRQNVGGKKDLTNAASKEFGRRMGRILDEYKQVIYVSAHELDLQAHYKHENFHLNSGSMEEARAVARGRETIFKANKRGFIKLEYFTDGSVAMKVFYLKKDQVELGHEQLLLASLCRKDTSGLPVNERFAPCREPDLSDLSMNADAPTSATITPGAHYDVGPLRRWIFGEHYRTTWATPIANIPILDLDTTFGGLTPFARGGGGQTHVLKFSAPDGQWYYFRSIDKDPTYSLSQNQALMSGVYGKIVQDLTSGQYPYGAFVTDHLMNAAGIYHTSPRLFIMPDHPKLGMHRELFAGMLGRLEIRPQGSNKNVEGFMGADRVIKTFRLFQYLLDDNDHRIDAPAYARARLFDLLVSDWDRQADNWKFMGFGDKKAFTFYPMPKDRDRAFSRWEGIYWLLDQEFGSPKISSFDYKWGDFKSLTFKARYIDRMLLSELDQAEWLDIARSLQTDLSDDVVEAAWQNIPPEAQPVAADKMVDILKTRRDDLPKATSKYYQLLARYVDVIGSNKREIFEVERFPNGDVKVEVFKKKKTGEKSDLLYSRLLHKTETREIRLYGLDNEDEFYFSGKANKSILTRVITGEDQDVVVDRSTVKSCKKQTLIYDHSKADSLVLGQTSRIVRTREPVVFTYQLWEPNSYLPMPSFVYNQDDGFGLGFGLSMTKHGFRKPGYAKKYFFRGAATTNENYWLNATADFHHVLGKWDWLLAGNISNSERSFRHFYGIGNETVKDNLLKEAGFYENQTNIQQASTGLRRTFWRRSNFILSTAFERYWVRSKADGERSASIFDELPELPGLGTNAFLGTRQELNLNLADAAFLPTRGVKFQLSHQYYFNLSETDSRFGKWAADMRFYETIRIAIPVTIGQRGGFQQTYGDVPFYYLARLGQRDNLRGFLRNRFTGQKAVYSNTDIRFDLGTIETAFVPFGIGLLGFYDVGKVWAKGVDSDKWHQGYGGGIYLSPVNENFNLTFSAARSEEENLLLEFTFGFSL